MSVGFMGNVGAGIRVGGGDVDRGFTDVSPPGMVTAPKSAFSQGTTIVAIAAAVWLAVLYVHWRQY